LQTESPVNIKMDSHFDAKIVRSAQAPAPGRLNRYKNAPDLGPRLLFFSGGTALREVSRELIRYTHNSIHIITPFDSGGSSAELRKAFHMPAVGDIRNRLLALADQEGQGSPEIYTLFAHRLGKAEAGEELFESLTRMARGTHALVAQIPDPMGRIIRRHLSFFLAHMPEKFNLKGASIGNLVLAAAYLDNGRLLDPAIDGFSNLVRVRGTVRPVVNVYRHLVAELASGKILVGQHRLTGKDATPIRSRVTRLYLSEKSRAPSPATVEISSEMRNLIQSAELICYPMGSFFSSVIANLLPLGVGDAIRQANCPKIYIPNTFPDPESWGLDPASQTEALLSYLKADGSDRIDNQQVLDGVVVDRNRGQYAEPIDERRLKAMGIDVIDYPLISRASAPGVDARRLVELLLSLI